MGEAFAPSDKRTPIKRVRRVAGGGAGEAFAPSDKRKPITCVWRVASTEAIYWANASPLQRLWRSQPPAPSPQPSALSPQPSARPGATRPARRSPCQ
ncbi:MAG: hypothetical protein H7Z42_05300, partial [Roseiflexaceae bacterium]|nr:hypothetical protein [Roseiflexaceae bacterium]